MLILVKERLRLVMIDLLKIHFFCFVYLCLTGCNAQDNRELNVYLESDKVDYFGIIYKKESCESTNSKLYYHIDSTGVFKTNDCFVSSNIINQHHFYLKTGNDYVEIGFYGRGYTRVVDSLYVSGIEFFGIGGWNIMIYKLGTIDELSIPIEIEDRKLNEFRNKCVKEISIKK